MSLPPKELRDLDEARRYVLQGFWLGRIAPRADTVGPILDWANAILGNGDPLPPIGFVADIGQIALGLDAGRQDRPPSPGWPAALADNYLHHVLGKFYADPAFERAGHALARYAPADRPRGLAFLLRQFRERAGLGGVEFSNAVIRSLRQMNPNDLLAEGAASLAQDGPLPLLKSQIEELVSAVRRLPDVLGPEDAIALEQRTALADLSRFIAHRQILAQTARFEARLPARPPRPPVGRREVPTRVLDEDQYPVGGYTSISNRGSVESLLHSQLAYMEPEESPDLFDVKFVRDELFYYSRDENQFLRRRRTFVFAFAPDLSDARRKDEELPCQRIVLVCAATLAIVRRLSAWLGDDALRFELRFARSGAAEPLASEAELFSVLLQEAIANGTAEVSHAASIEAIAADAERSARKAQVQVLEWAVTPSMPEPPGAVRIALRVADARPGLTDGFGLPVELDADDALDAWDAAVRSVLEFWV